MIDLDHIDAWDWDVPDELIAHEPSSRRTDARLLVVDPSAGSWRDARIPDLTTLLGPGDLLVFNDVRVSPVRLSARRSTGGAVEVFVVGLGDEGAWTDPAAPLVSMVRSSKSLRPGEVLTVDGTTVALRMTSRRPDGLWSFAAVEGDAWALIDAAGQVPLPPYILRRRAAARGDAKVDERVSADEAERYQTVFARAPGAVAAPTAGLHFDAPLLDSLRELGVEVAFTTLWVGMGTFRPVATERLGEHAMHRERYEVPPATVQAIAAARRRGARVIAVGTTVVRTLEAAWDDDRSAVAPGPGSTQLFIRPGYRFRVVDALITNFHLPRSTLLALVGAFGGYTLVRAAYAHAVSARYRFFSWGDAMFLCCRAPDA